jgi:hypothetical protein
VSNLLITRDDRRPTLRFGRPNFLEPGIQVVYYWNGTRAPNGDGVPGGAAAIDYDTPLAGPLPLFNDDQLIPFGGRYGAGPYAALTARRSPSGGYGGGPYGAGGYGVGGSWFDWQFPFPLRDGVYSIARCLADALGNVADPPGLVDTLEIAAVPRTPSLLSWEVSGGIFYLRWAHSPEFAPTE